MKKYQAIVFAGFLAGGTLFALDVTKKDLSYYEPADLLGGVNQNVTVSSSIQMTDGKFGKAFRIERRTVNAIENGDLAKEKSDSILYRDDVEFLPNGGINNSSCLQIMNGEIALPLLNLKDKQFNAFSFYVKRSTISDEPAKITVRWESGGKSQTLLKNKAVTDDFIRITCPLLAKADSGTVQISVEGAVVVDNFMLDKGVNFFNNYSEPGKTRGVDMISLPVADNRYFNAEQGTFTAWVNADWLKKNAVSNQICGLFSVKNAEQQQAKWADNMIIWFSAIPNTSFGDQSGAIHLTTIDSAYRIAGISEKQELLNLPNQPWHFIAFSWEVKDGNLKLAMYIDGDKVKLEKTMPFGPVKTPSEITIGYGSGAYLNGAIDDIAIFRKALSPADVMELYQAEAPLGTLLK